MGVEIEVTVLRETDKALLVMITESKEEIWLPRSQVVEGEIAVGDSGSLTITDWIAREKGLD